MSASRPNCTAWNSAMGLPNCRRSCAYFAACPHAPHASPQQLRRNPDPPFVQRLNRNLVPLAHFAQNIRDWDAAIIQQQLRTWDDARIPSLSSFLPTLKPAISRSTRNAVMPL